MRGNELKIGVIGLGHWGPNHVRVFEECAGAHVVMCADSDQVRRDHIEQRYPNIVVVAHSEEVFGHPEIDAVVIATPAHTHCDLAKRALQAGKHVLLEKPMCTSIEEASELVALSRRTHTVLVHGHVFTYNRGIQFVKAGIDRGDFGKIQYLSSVRTNLGPIRYDVNVVRDLAAHEFSIFDYVFDSLPTWIQAAGSCALDTPREDVAFLSMEYPGGILVHIEVSWLHPQKMRTLTLVGNEKMVVWDDLNLAEPVRVYDKGVVKEPYYDSYGDFKLRLRDSDVTAPKLDHEEPLKLQAESFVKRIRDGIPTSSEAESGLRVMHCLEAVAWSLEDEGRRVHLEEVGLRDPEKGVLR
jgi:predicted dehydrogenase